MNFPLCVPARYLYRCVLSAAVLLIPAAGAVAMVSLEPRSGEPAPLVYAAIGASDGSGVGAGGPEYWWVTKLHRRMPPGTRQVNASVDGSLASEAVVEQLPVVLRARPDVVTVWLAGNDFTAGVPLPQYIRSLDEILSRLRATGARVYVGNVPDLSALPGVPANLKPAVAQSVQAWNREISRTAGRHGAVVVDLAAGQTAADLRSLVSPDGFHPSAAGYARLADLFWQRMKLSSR